MDKKTKLGIKSETCKCPIEIGAEGNVDLMKGNKFAGKVAAKMTCGKKYTTQTMLDSDYKLTNAFTYIPRRGFKFIWSDQLDTKKFFTNPTGGIDYRYGFTFEFNIGSI